MSVTEFTRGVPTYKDEKTGKEIGMLCETKEVCVTDNDGVSLEYKLQNLLQEINNLISGTQKVGNAEKLDGHGAEYFQTVGGETLGTSILEKALSYTEDGIYNYRLLGGSYTGTDLPNNDYKNGQATVITRVASGNKYGTTVILWGANNSSYVQRIAVNYYASSGWTGWKEFATTEDLAKYLPNTGGTLTSSNTNAPFVLDQTTSITTTLITYKHKGVNSGGIGMDGATKKPVVNIPNRGLYDILHTGDSAKVVVSQTAPSDTSALWVW